MYGNTMYSSVIAEQAVALGQGLFDQANNLDLPKRPSLAVVTGLSITDGHSEPHFYQVYSELFGDPDVAKEYLQYAVGKAMLTARERMPSGEVIDNHPELLRPGDVAYRGGFILGNIVTACSAVQSRIDELVSAAVCYGARTLIGLRTDETRGLTLDRDAPAFFPEGTVPR